MVLFWPILAPKYEVFDLCVYKDTCITVIDKVLLSKEVRQKGTD
jgi:hypothetical protein